MTTRSGPAGRRSHLRRRIRARRDHPVAVRSPATGDRPTDDRAPADPRRPTLRAASGRRSTPSAAPRVGEMLQAAREKKGVDLYRAERDTKIRARHLAALESGDYAELPGAGLRQGLPAQLRALPRASIPTRCSTAGSDEQDRAAAAASGVAVAPPPQPITEPRRGLTFTPGHRSSPRSWPLIVLAVRWATSGSSWSASRRCRR